MRTLRSMEYSVQSACFPPPVCLHHCSGDNSSTLTLPGLIRTTRDLGETVQRRKKKKKELKTYNSRDSLVVTHPTTNRPACGLSTAERTGSPVFHTLWSYVVGYFDSGLTYKVYE